MKKTQEVEVIYIKKTTSLGMTVIALILGFALGLGYSSFDKTGPKEIKYVPDQQKQKPKQEEQHDHSADNRSAQINQLKQLVEADPNDAKSWALLGHNYFDTNRPVEAIFAYKKYIDLDPDNANVWTDLGVMYRRSGNPTEALAAFNNAIKIDPKHEVSRFNKGIVQMHDLKDIEGALKTWEDLLKLNPSAKTPNGQPLEVLIQQVRESIKKK